MFKRYFLVPSIVTALGLMFSSCGFVISLGVRLSEPKSMRADRQSQYQRELDEHDQMTAEQIRAADERLRLEQPEHQQRIANLHKEQGDLAAARAETMNQITNLETHMEQIRSSMAPNNQSEPLLLDLSRKVKDLNDNIANFARREEEINREMREAEETLKRVESEVQHRKEEAIQNKNRWMTEHQQRLQEEEEQRASGAGRRIAGIVPGFLFFCFMFPVMTWFFVAFLNVLLLILIHVSETMRRRLQTME